MTVTEWKEAVQALVTSVALVVGGGWALWRFVLQREGRAKIEFSLAPQAAISPWLMSS